LKQNILIINPWTGYIGPNTFFQQFVLQSIDKSCTITVIYPYEDEISRNLEKKGVKFFYTKILKPIHYSSSLIKLFFYLIKEITLFFYLFKIDTNFDVIILNSELFSLSIFSLSKTARKFNIIHSLSFTNNHIFSKILFTIHKNNNITNIAVSNVVMNKIKLICSISNTVVFYNGVNIVENYKKSFFDDINQKLQILSVLHPVPHKGGHHLVDLLNKLNLHNNNFICNIVGWDGPISDSIYRRNVEKKIVQFGLQDKINLLPPTKNITNYFESADILVHTSESESFGYVIAEAMAFQLPVIAFNVGAIPEIVQNGISGYLVEPFNISEMSRLLIKLIENKKLQRDFGIKGKEIVTQNFNKTKNMHNLITYCLNL
jgi:glycosyltransferase involved in cell wall biosynthesis